MLTQTEWAASKMLNLTKCAKCKHRQQNWKLEYVSCGLSPKTCNKFQLHPDIAKQKAEELFKT